MPPDRAFIKKKPVVLADDSDTIILNAHPVFGMGAKVNDIFNVRWNQIVQVFDSGCSRDIRIFQADAQEYQVAVAHLLVIKTKHVRESVYCEPAVISAIISVT